MYSGDLEQDNNANFDDVFIVFDDAKVPDEKQVHKESQIEDMLLSELNKLAEIENKPIDVLNASAREAQQYVHNVAYQAGRISVLSELLMIESED